MAKIDPKDKKYIITFKRKDLRPNKRDDKFEIFRQIIGLEDVRDIADITRLVGSHKEDPLHKTRVTVTDINNYETPFIAARLTPDQVGRLRRDPNIEIVEEEQVYYPVEEFPGWQVGSLKADQAWAAPLSSTGSGVNVAIIDTGCHPHLDFGPNLRINQNFTTGPDARSSDAVHHGTHVCGITGAAKDNNEGIQGIAPNCNIWNLRTAVAGFFSADLLEAWQYCNQNNAQVVNMSLGLSAAKGAVAIAAEQQALTALFNKGTILVAAAGNNEGEIPGGQFWPAAYSGVIGISNINQGNNLDTSSNFGTHVDFTSPGTQIQSLAENNLYRTLTGTSMASPAFSGLCALCLAVYNDNGCPPYDPPGAPKNVIIEKVIKDSATKTGLTNAGPLGQRDIRYGWGLPQANVAVAALKGVAPSALVA
jgi:subtilisin